MLALWLPSLDDGLLICDPMKASPRLLTILLACALAVTASCSDSGVKSVGALDGKKVLVLSLDTLRADMLGSYGSTGGHMPILDGLAAKGVVFRNAIAPMATTFPSHSSMFTGLYPRVHGVRWNGDSLKEEHTTLAEILSQEGWNTGAFVSYKAMVARGGLDQGFQAVSDLVFNGTMERIRSGQAVNELAFDYLDEVLEDNPKKNTFLWLHYFEPHAPYPLTEYAEKALEGYTGPLADGAEVSEFAGLDEEGHAALRALYEGRVRETDDLVGELLAGLEERGILDETILVIVGDHGQLLGEHNHVGHGSILWQEVLDVPFIVVDPFDPHVGVVDTRVGVVDLAPTLLELLGFESLEGMQGRSLLPALSGSTMSDEVYFSEVRIADPRQARAKGQSDAVAVFSGPYKFVLDGEKEILWNMVEDHGENSRLDLDQYEEVVQRLQPLASHHKELSPEALANPSEVSQEMLEELAELGYVDGDSE